MGRERRRSRVERYGSEDSTIAGTLRASRGVIRECEGALAALASMERRESGVCQCVRGQTVEDAVELSDDEEDVEILAVIHPAIAPPALVKHQRPVDQARNEVIGGAFLTAEDISGHQKKLGALDGAPLTAEDISEHQKEPGALDGAFLTAEDISGHQKKLGALDGASLTAEGISEYQKELGALDGAPLTAEDISAHQKKPGAVDGAFLTAEDISGHQKKLGALDTPQSCTSVEVDVVLSAVLKEAKCALKRLTGKKALQKVEVVVSGKRERGKEHNADDGDELEDHMFGSPRHKKTRDVKYAKSDDDEPDYEVRIVASDSEREPSPEVEDPFDDVWKEVAVMQRQGKRSDDDGEGDERCEHVYEIKNDVGRACSLCGLIKEDIKDMLFKWHAPKTVRQQSQARVGRADAWGEDGDGVLEEEARLVGMAPLEAHNSLEDAMHPHQVEGFKFLSKNLVEEDSGGCMLAFAPGTGKSFLIISFIHSFMLQVPNARPMIVAPKSMLRPWTQEFKKWQVEEMTVLNLYEAGDDAAKVEMLKLWQETRSVLLVGYAQCTNMCGEIGRYLIEGPGLMVLDEGHLARTEKTKILKSLSRVHTKRRVLLSGTPFNNNFQEFYTTLELVRPDFMRKASVCMEATLNTLMPSEPKTSETVSPLPKRSSNAGRQAFKDAIGENLFESGKHDSVTRALGQLRKLIEPFVAWHKGQILETLPGITDLTITLELSPKQRELLKNNRSEVRDNLQKRAAAIYIHPILEPVSEGGKRTQKDPRLRGESIDLKQGVKLRWVLDLVQLCDAAKEKVLIFSEYLYSLALIENVAMDTMKWSKGSQILRIDGSMDPPVREAVINKFNNDPEAKMLCASIKACGEGISLVGASRVVILEVVWNPSVTRQAISRAFRIGQRKKVVVYRLIAADSYEEHRMHATAIRKEWLSKLLFDPSISCDDPNSILWDVTDPKVCTDTFLERGALRDNVKSIYEREF